MTVDGTVDTAFAEVGEALRSILSGDGRQGAACAVIVEGAAVVDAWGGAADDSGRPWRGDTLVNVYSVGKPLAAACLLRLVDDGRVGLDDPVGRCWPEYATAGKEPTTVRHLLAHQAGLDAFAQPLEPGLLLDWDACAGFLAAARPRWEPGTRHGEHALFYGHLVGELVRRVDGRSIGAFLRDEIARPWSLDVALGLDESALGRAADVVDPGGSFARSVRDRGGWYRRAMDNPTGMLDPTVVNGAAWRRAEVPAVNLHATPRGIARFYAGLGARGTLDGVALFSPALVSDATGAPQRLAPDEVLGEEVAWGLGVQVGDDWFGMGGLGGNVGVWSRDGYAFAYVTRRLGTFDPADRLENAVRSALGLPPLDDPANG